MSESVQTKIIARIHNSFKTKFGIPRQSGIENTEKSVIVFEKEYRDENALRGIEEYSHLWLIWYFSESESKKWSPTVRPPRLGGNTRIGVFATRSPNRPNPIGLSCVKLEGIEKTKENGTVLYVSGADLMDGTPIFDIKPYLTLSDVHTDAVCGFAEKIDEYRLCVDIPEIHKNKLSREQFETVTEILAEDPRPSYQNEPERVYGLRFGEYEIKFTVDEKKLTVTSIEKAKE